MKTQKWKSNKKSLNTYSSFNYKHKKEGKMDVSADKSKCMPIPLPIIMMKEDEWFVACCPILDIATQGKTEKEVKENMADLIDDYFQDPDTVKPKISSIETLSMTFIPKVLPIGSHNETQTISPAESCPNFGK